MKLNKILATLFLCAIAVLTVHGVSANAASKKVKITPSTKEYKLDSLKLTVSASFKEENVEKIELKKGKVKKTADKYWEDAYSESFSYNKKKGKTEAEFYIHDNGTYSARVTTKSGKKYVKSIKVDNIVVQSEHSEQIKTITDISSRDSKGNYKIKVDFKYPLNTSSNTFEDTYTGDTIYLPEGPVVIQDFMWKDENGDIKHQDYWDEYIQCIVVLPKNPADFYDMEKCDYLYDNPEHADFGFLPGDYDNEYVAYDDYEYWDDGDYYVPLYRTIYSGIEFKITGKTKVKLAYSEEGAPNIISGREYFDIMTGHAEEIEGVHIYGDLNYYLYEDYTEKDGFTDVVKYLVEIYMP